MAMLPLAAFLLVSYAVLPIKYTNRHYATICFTIAVSMLQIPFVIPLGTKPQKCHDAITPNNQDTSLSCAFTGAILLFGGMAVVTWSFIRTLALHLQVCWEVMLGPKFMWAALLAGWGVPALITTVMMIYTGVSYRFGSTCHINSPNSTGTYWVPLTVIAGLSLLMQVTTVAHCIHVYIRAALDPSPTSTNTSELPSYQGSVRTVSKRQAYKRVRRIIQLQWRSIALVTVILINVIFFAVVFLRFNTSIKPTKENVEKAQAWIRCLALFQDPKKCTQQAEGVALDEPILVATVVLLAISMFWNFIFTVRSSFIRGWIDLVRGFFGERMEFVSADARARGSGRGGSGSGRDSRTYEMLSSSEYSDMNQYNGGMKSPPPPAVTAHSTTARSPSPAWSKDYEVENGANTLRSDYYYNSPPSPTSSPRYNKMSFSSLQPPSLAQQRHYHGQAPEWDPSSTFAPPKTFFQ